MYCIVLLNCEILLQMSYNTIIMYPNTPTTLILGKRLLTEQHNLYLYTPEDVHTTMANTMPQDLQLAALGLGVSVEVVTTLEKTEEADFLVVNTQLKL